jgi:hypothetical protein
LIIFFLFLYLARDFLLTYIPKLIGFIHLLNLFH